MFHKHKILFLLGYHYLLLVRRCDFHAVLVYFNVLKDLLNYWKVHTFDHLILNMA